MADNLQIVITAKDQASKPIHNVGTSLSEVGKLAAGVFGGALLTKGFDMLVRGAQDVVGALGGMVSSAMDAQEVEAQLDTVLRSTAGAAGMSKDALIDLADALSRQTRFEDEAILSAENMLLTFTNIGKDVFPQATETVLNMSQALGQDLKSSSIQLGKALQDPVLGVTALRRVGVMLTDSQKELIGTMVASGDIMGAQKVILQELQVEFGGSAKAAGETFGGQLDRIGNRLGNIGETIGLAVIPALQYLATQFITVLDSPAVHGAISTITDWITNSLNPGLQSVGTQIMAFIQTVAQAIKDGDWTVVYTTLAIAFENAWSSIKTTLAGWATKFWEWLIAPEGGAISMAGTVLTTVGTALYNAGSSMWAQLTGWAASFWGWLIMPETGALSFVGTALSAVGTALFNAGSNIWTALTGWAASFWAWLTAPETGAIATAGSVLSSVGTALYNAGSNLWTAISEWAISFWTWLLDPKAGAVSFVSGVMETVGGFIAGVGGNIWAALSGWATEFWVWLTGEKGAVANVTSNVKQVGEVIATNWPEISGKLIAWADKFWEWLTGEKGAASKATAELKQVGEAMQAAAKSEEVLSVWYPAGQYLGEKAGGALIDAFIGLFKPPEGSGVISLGNSLLNTLASLATSKTLMLMADVVGINSALGIINGLYNAVVARKEEIKTFFFGWFEFIGKTVSDTVGLEKIVEWWDEVGKGIWDGIATAVENAIKDAGEWFTKIANQIIDKLKAALGISSPSTLAIPIGTAIAEGIIVGIQQGEQGLTDAGELALDKAFKHWLSSMMGGLKKGHVYSQLRNQIFDMISEFGTVAGETYGQAAVRLYNQILQNAPAQLIPRLQASFAQLMAEIAPIANQVVDNTMARVRQYFSAAGVFGGLASTAGGLLQSRELQPLQTELEQLGNYYDSLTESLARVTAELNAATDPADIERLRIIQAAIANDIGTTQFRITANKERQLEIERELTALQRQQEDLGFLQAQASLVQMIADNGLNAREILGGLTLGLDANLSGVIEAMTRAMQMMIARAEETLGVASPSKRFAEIGRNIMAGLSAGVRVGTPAAAGQVASSTQHIVNNTYNLTANYAYQDARSLSNDIRMLQMLGAYT